MDDARWHDLGSVEELAKHGAGVSGGVGGDGGGRRGAVTSSLGPLASLPAAYPSPPHSAYRSTSQFASWRHEIIASGRIR
jgi:hypothetical protein